jgi:DNA repair photolyase
MIYEPKGKAREYAPLALNIYKGCTHGCLYCYGPSAMHTTRQEYFSDSNAKKDTIRGIIADCRKHVGCQDEILLSFIGDPYQPDEMTLGLTRAAIQLLIQYGLRFTILTKGGTRACRDFDFLERYPQSRFGSTIVFMDQRLAAHWEPGASSIQDRIDAVKRAHALGIATWISLEPVIEPEQALEVIRELHPYVGHWKVGKINHSKDEEVKHDWIGFREEVSALLKSVEADFYIKDSLTSQV